MSGMDAHLSHENWLQKFAAGSSLTWGNNSQTSGPLTEMNMLPRKSPHLVEQGKSRISSHTVGAKKSLRSVSVMRAYYAYVTCVDRA